MIEINPYADVIDINRLLNLRIGDKVLIEHAIGDTYTIPTIETFVFERVNFHSKIYTFYRLKDVPIDLTHNRLKYLKTELDKKGWL